LSQLIIAQSSCLGPQCADEVWERCWGRHAKKSACHDENVEFRERLGNSRLERFDPVSANQKAHPPILMPRSLGNQSLEIFTTQRSFQKMANSRTFSTRFLPSDFVFKSCPQIAPTVNGQTHTNGSGLLIDGNPTWTILPLKERPHTLLSLRRIS
jgi:hypothetical protein